MDTIVGVDVGLTTT